jgi:hypothetical protein
MVQSESGFPVINPEYVVTAISLFMLLQLFITRQQFTNL